MESGKKGMAVLKGTGTFFVFCFGVVFSNVFASYQLHCFWSVLNEFK